MTSLETLSRRVRNLERELREIKREKEWMTVKEFMDLTGLKRKTAYNYSSSKFFTTKRKGGLKFKRSEVIKWWESENKLEKAA